MIYIAGHNGMVGSALLKRLKVNPANKFTLANKGDLDLRDQIAVNNFFKINKPFICATSI